jgi:hypothetical protein
VAEASAVGITSQVWRPKTGLKSKTETETETETGITGQTKRIDHSPMKNGIEYINQPMCINSSMKPDVSCFIPYPIILYYITLY